MWAPHPSSDEWNWVSGHQKGSGIYIRVASLVLDGINALTMILPGNPSSVGTR